MKEQGLGSRVKDSWEIKRKLLRHIGDIGITSGIMEKKKETIIMGYLGG